MRPCLTLLVYTKHVQFIAHDLLVLRSHNGGGNNCHLFRNSKEKTSRNYCIIFCNEVKLSHVSGRGVLTNVKFPS